MCTECERDGRCLSADWMCMDDACDLRPLCDGHVIVHRAWGHVVGPLVHQSGPPAAALLGVTHCPKLEHMGPDAALLHVCMTCQDGTPLCRSCSYDDHLIKGHTVELVTNVAAKKLVDIDAAPPRAAGGAGRQATGNSGVGGGTLSAACV